MLGPLFIHKKNYFTETKRNEMLFFKKRNETERYFFWNRNRKPKLNKYISETKRNETKRNEKNNVF
jgi:hypothetical protein